jgi:RNA polymerase sigma-70 factor (ECF subfamily)
MMDQAHEKRSNPSSAERPPPSLVEAARGGNRKAFTGLMERYRGEIFRMVYYRIRSRMDAEDITQDVFFQAFRKLPGLREADRFRPWLFSIALNRLRDFQRRRKFGRLFSSLDEKGETAAGQVEAPDADDPSEAVSRKEFWQGVHRFLDKLSKGEREVFLLRFFDQLTLKEIAGVLRKSESAVKTHLYRALSKCREDAALFQLLEE